MGVGHTIIDVPNNFLEKCSAFWNEHIAQNLRSVKLNSKKYGVIAFIWYLEEILGHLQDELGLGKLFISICREIRRERHGLCTYNQQY